MERRFATAGRGEASQITKILARCACLAIGNRRSDASVFWKAKMRARPRLGGLRHARYAQARLASGSAFELGGLRGSEEVGVEEIGGEEGFDEGERGGSGVVFCDIARGVAENEGEPRPALEHDGADEDVFQGGVCATVFAEGEFDERAFRDGGAQ
jgi:hypothetical protein